MPVKCPYIAQAPTILSPYTIANIYYPPHKLATDYWLLATDPYSTTTLNVLPPTPLFTSRK